MKAMIAILSLMTMGSTVFANDGGVAAIKVDQIKMREVALKDGKEVIVKKIASPSYKIVFEGGEAAKLQKILPSTVSVITNGMSAEQAKMYNESFKTLGIYSDKSKEASGKIMTISCSDGKFNDDYTKVSKTGKSVCEITISASEYEGAEADAFGDIQKFEPKSCK